MAATKRRRKENAPGWAWMLFGLSIGLTVALVVYLKSGGPILPARREFVAPPAEQSVQAPAASAVPTQARTVTPEPVESGAASPEEDAEAEFRFYELLRQLEVRIPETERKQDRADAAPSAYQIQAGSFRTFDEADSRQARLALLGIESRVVRAIVDNNIWHRVIIGPLSDREEIARVLRRLREERIDAMPPQAVSD